MWITTQKSDLVIVCGDGESYAVSTRNCNEGYTFLPVGYGVGVDTELQLPKTDPQEEDRKSSGCMKMC
jgi:hypothetical protein